MMFGSYCFTGDDHKTSTIILLKEIASTPVIILFYKYLYALLKSLNKEQGRQKV